VSIRGSTFDPSVGAFVKMRGRAWWSGEGEEPQRRGGRRGTQSAGEVEEMNHEEREGHEGLGSSMSFSETSLI
jgi:hypothetical protein